MENDDFDFMPIEVISDDGEVMVSLEFLDEGDMGDFDPDDPDDTPLLRYSLYLKYQEGMEDDDILRVCDPDDYTDGDWMAVTDGSYCTQLSAEAPVEQLEQAAKLILREVESSLKTFTRKKRLYEELSWITLDEQGNPLVPKNA